MPLDSPPRSAPTLIARSRRTRDRSTLACARSRLLVATAQFLCHRADGAKAQTGPAPIID